jgi:hypothetical protein
MRGGGPRILPLGPPSDPSIETMLNKWMPPGSVVEPLALLRTLAVMNDDLPLTGLDSAVGEDSCTKRPHACREIAV